MVLSTDELVIVSEDHTRRVPARCLPAETRDSLQQMLGSGLLVGEAATVSQALALDNISHLLAELVTELQLIRQSIEIADRKMEEATRGDRPGAGATLRPEGVAG